MSSWISKKPSNLVLTVRYSGLRATQYFSRPSDEAANRLKKDLAKLKFPQPKVINIRFIAHGCMQVIWPEPKPPLRQSLYSAVHRIPRAGSETFNWYTEEDLAELSIESFSLQQIPPQNNRSQGTSQTDWSPSTSNSSGSSSARQTRQHPSIPTYPESSSAGPSVPIVQQAPARWTGHPSSAPSNLSVGAAQRTPVRPRHKANARAKYQAEAPSRSHGAPFSPNSTFQPRSTDAPKRPPSVRLALNSISQQLQAVSISAPEGQSWPSVQTHHRGETPPQSHSAPSMSNSTFQTTQPGPINALKRPASRNSGSCELDPGPLKRVKTEPVEPKLSSTVNHGSGSSPLKPVRTLVPIIDANGNMNSTIIPPQTILNSPGAKTAKVKTSGASPEQNEGQSQSLSTQTVTSRMSGWDPSPQHLTLSAAVSPPSKKEQDQNSANQATSTELLPVLKWKPVSQSSFLTENKQVSAPQAQLLDKLRWRPPIAPLQAQASIPGSASSKPRQAYNTSSQVQLPTRPSIPVSSQTQQEREFPQEPLTRMAAGNSQQQALGSQSVILGARPLPELTTPPQQVPDPQVMHMFQPQTPPPDIRSPIGTKRPLEAETVDVSKAESSSSPKLQTTAGPFLIQSDLNQDSPNKRIKRDDTGGDNISLVSRNTTVSELRLGGPSNNGDLNGDQSRHAGFHRDSPVEILCVDGGNRQSLESEVIVILDDDDDMESELPTQQQSDEPHPGLLSNTIAMPQTIQQASRPVRARVAPSSTVQSNLDPRIRELERQLASIRRELKERLDKEVNIYRQIQETDPTYKPGYPKCLVTRFKDLQSRLRTKDKILVELQRTAGAAQKALEDEREKHRKNMEALEEERRTRMKVEAELKLELNRRGLIEGELQIEKQKRLDLEDEMEKQTRLRVSSEDEPWKQKAMANSALEALEAERGTTLNSMEETANLLKESLANQAALRTISEDARSSRDELERRLDMESKLRIQLEEMLKKERCLRVEAEAVSKDVERECRSPFVMPALMEAFAIISDVTTRAIDDKLSPA